MTRRERRRRVCASCRSEWPEGEGYCRGCGRWLGQALRIIPEFWFGLDPGRADLPVADLEPWMEPWAGLPASFTGPVVQETSALVVLTTADTPVVPTGTALHTWLDELPRLMDEHRGLLPESAQVMGLVALFTDPDDRRHVERALAAGLAVRGRAAALGLGDARSPARVHLAVNTGPIALSRPHPDAPPRAWSVQGGVLDLAHRLAISLGPGLLVASRATYRLAGHGYRAYGTAPLYEDLGRRSSTVYVITGTKPVVTWREQPAQDPSPMVDREAERARLEQAWQEVEAGRGRVVHLIAEPGGGKSRLLRTFERWLTTEGGCELLLRAWGACYGTRDYELIAQLLTAIRMPEEDRQRAVSATAGGGVPAPERSGGTSDVARTVAAELDSGSARVRPDQVAAMLARLVPPRQPAAILFDDLHWADSRSLQALRLLLPAWRARPLLVVLSYRPSLEQRFDLAPGPDDVLVRLEGLDEKAAQAVLEARAKDLGSDRRQAILRQARGNPLYIQEAAELAKRERDGPPETLFELLLRRIESLAASELKRLEATGGMDATWSALPRQELDRIEGQINDWLDRIEGGGYLGLAEVAVLLGRLRHLDLRLRTLRWRLGQAVALNDRLREAIARLHSAPAAEWHRAIESYLRERGDRRGALTLAVQAAQGAQARDDHAGSAELLRLAADLAGEITGDPTAPSRASLLVELGGLLELIGLPAEAEATYRPALGHPAAALPAAIRLAVLAAEAGRLEEAEALLAEAGPAARAASAESAVELAAAAARLALARAERGARRRAREAMTKAAATGRDDLALEVALALLGRPSRGVGRWDEQATLLAHWSQGGREPWSVPAYLVLARRLGRRRDRAAATLSARYLRRARWLARELRLNGWLADASPCGRSGGANHPHVQEFEGRGVDGRPQPRSSG